MFLRYQMADKYVYNSTHLNYFMERYWLSQVLGRLIDWMIDWSIKCLLHWLIAWLVGWLFDWLIDCLIGWLIDFWLPALWCRSVIFHRLDRPFIFSNFTAPPELTAIMMPVRGDITTVMASGTDLDHDRRGVAVDPPTMNDAFATVNNTIRPRRPATITGIVMPRATIEMNELTSPPTTIVAVAVAVAAMTLMAITLRVAREGNKLDLMASLEHGFLLHDHQSSRCF